MNDIIIQWLPLSLSFAALVGLMVVLFAVMRGRDDQAKLLALFEQLRADRSGHEQQQELADNLASIKKQFAMLGKQIADCNDNYDDLKQQFSQLSHRHTALEQQLLQQQEAIQEVAEQDPESKFYQRAARLVQQGASLEEVMEACELPRAEAELLYNLYKK